MSDMHIGARLERERLDRGMSQDEAAEMLGVSQATFSRWVQGATPKSTYWVKIGRFLKIPRDEVAGIVNAARTLDPAGDRMRALEDRFDGLDRRLDAVAQAQTATERALAELVSLLGPTAAPKRRRAR